MLKSSSMPKKGAYIVDCSRNSPGRVLPFYSPIHQQLALLYLKVLCEYLVIFSLFGWTMFPYVMEQPWPGV